MPEFTKRRSIANVDLIKLTAAPKNSVLRQSHPSALHSAKVHVNSLTRFFKNGLGEETYFAVKHLE